MLYSFFTSFFAWLDHWLDDISFDRPCRFKRDPLDLNQPIGTAPRRPSIDLTGNGPLDYGRIFTIALREKRNTYPSLLIPEHWGVDR